MSNARLLVDEPVDADEFGTHQRIADQLLELIKATGDSPTPHSIGLMGAWGSGKSSIVRMLQRRIGEQDAKSIHLFTYDAWAHDGDSLRKAFIDALERDLERSRSESVQSKKRPKRNANTDTTTDAETGIWDRHEETRSTSEPIIRNHAKVLLVSLALFAVGLKLFSVPALKSKSYWMDLLLGANVPALFLMSLPGLAMAVFMAINKWGKSEHKALWFGSEKERGKRFSVWSGFLRRIDGEVERKWTTTPRDSILKFGEAFTSLLAKLDTVQKRKKLVLVIDNIDRLDPSGAREFWSTMRALFDRSIQRYAGIDPSRVWLIVPIADESVPALFDRDYVDGNYSQAFLDKTFDLTFHVPIPIQTNSTAYFAKKLDYAFPASSFPAAATRAVAALYEYAMLSVSSASLVGRTPRQMKLFVNRLVALQSTLPEAIPLEALCAYLLHKDQIGGADIPVALLSPLEQSLLPALPDWRVQVAAAHFGVGLDEASQIVLEEPLRRALLDGDAARVKELEERPGFRAALYKAIDAETLPTPELAASKVLNTLKVLQEAELAADPQRLTLLRRRLARSQTLGFLKAGAAEMLTALLLDIPDELDRMQHLSIWAEGLGGPWLAAANLSAVTGDVATRAADLQTAVARQWGELAAAIINLAPKGAAPAIQVPLLGPYFVRAIDKFATDIREVSDAKNLAIQDNDSWQLSIANWPGESSGPENPRKFFDVLFSIPSLVVDLGEVANQLSNIVSPSLTPERLSNILHSLASMAVRTDGAPATETIRDLVTSHRLMALVAAMDDVALRAKIVALIALYQPNYSWSQLRPLPPGGTQLSSMLAEPSDAFSGELAGFLMAMLLVGTVVTTMAADAKWHTVLAGILPAVLRAEYKMALTIDGARAFFAYLSSRSDPDIVATFGLLANGDEIIARLIEPGLKADDVPFATHLLGTSFGSSSRELHLALVSWLEAVESADWYSAITDAAPATVPLWHLASELEKQSIPFVLGTRTLDATVQVANQVADGSVAWSEGTQLNLERALGWIRPDIRSNFKLHLGRILLKLASADQIRRLLSSFSNEIGELERADASAFIVGPLRMIVEDPTEETVEWATKFARKNTSKLKSAKGPISELLERIDATAGGVEPDSPIARQLASLRELLTPTARKAKARRVAE